MMERLFLWVFLFSACSMAVMLRKRSSVDRWFLAVVLLIAAVSGLGIAVPEARRAAFIAASAAVLAFIVLPGLLVRAARRGVIRGRFQVALAFIRPAAILLPSDALRREREIYRKIVDVGEDEHPAAAEIRQRLAARSTDDGRAPLCAAFAAILVVAHVLVTLVGDSESILTLTELGANQGDLVRGGQVYRLMTAAFLHMGMLHLVVNVLAFLVIGKWVEPRLGRPATLVVILLSGLVGNVASFLVYGAEGLTSVGASGAAMGLVGAATALRVGRDDDALRSRQLTALLLMIGATLFLGFVEPLVDNGAHLGGLGAGLLIGALFRLAPCTRVVPARAAAALLVVAAGISIAWMLRDLPGWRREEPFEGTGFAFSRPAFLLLEESGPRWWFSGAAGGDLTLSLEPASRDVEERLATRLAEIADEMRGADARPEVLVRGPGSPDVAGPDLAGAVFARTDTGSKRIDVYVFRDPESPRIAVLTFSLPDPDPVLRERLVLAVLRSFRFS